MRLALFGDSDSTAPVVHSRTQNSLPDVVIVQSKEKKVIKGFRPRQRVTLRVGNEFEGMMHEMVHEADTLSSLVAEHEAIKAAKKKFCYVEVVSVESI